MPDLSSEPTVQPESLPGRPNPRYPDEVSPQAYGSSLGQGIENAGIALQAAHEAAVKQAVQTQYTAGLTQLQGVQNDLTVNPASGAFTKQGQNAFNLTNQYLPQFDDRAKAIIAATPNPVAQRHLTLAAAQVRGHLTEQLDNYELKQHNDYATETATASMKMAATTAAFNYDHPDIVAANKDTVNFNVDSIADREGWSDEKRENAKQQALTDFHTTIIDSMVEHGSVSKARSYLFMNSTEIDPKAADGMQRMLLAKEEHDTVMNDKIQRDASNSLLKNAILMSQKGSLTAAYIERYHNTWEPQAYEYAYNLLSGKKTDTDPHTYAPMMLDAMAGKDVTDQAKDALYSGQLSLADFKGIIEKSEAPRKGYVARGADYITQSLKSNPLVPDPAGQRSLANAMDDWRQWTQDNPDADENKARSAYQTITDHYQIVQGNQVTLFNAVPLHLVGSRTQPNIPATAQATVDAHARGELSDAEFARQKALIVQWQSAMAKKTPSKATP